MRTADLKKNIHKAVDAVNNSALLEAVYTILNQNINVGKSSFPVLTLDEFYARNKQSELEIEKGLTISQKEIKRQYSRR